MTATTIAIAIINNDANANDNDKDNGNNSNNNGNIPTTPITLIIVQLIIAKVITQAKTSNHDDEITCTGN